MSKKIINDGDHLLGKIVEFNRVEKASQAYIDDVTVGKVLQPSIVRLSDNDCWNLYRGNEWIMACVNRIVADCIKVCPRVVPKDKTIKISGRMQKRIKEIEDFLDNPNNNKESFFEIREKVIKDMCIFGRGTMEKVVDASRKVLEVYGICSQYIKLRSDEHGTLPDVGAYQFMSTIGGGANDIVLYDIDELIFMVLHPSTKSQYGFKILDNLANAVAADILRAAYNANFFSNSATAEGVISLEGMSKTELGKFRDYWQKAVKGVKNAHRTVAVNVPIKYIRTAVTNRDMQFSEYGTELRTKIFAAYGVPPFIMGIVDASTGKLNSGQQIELYKDGALRPILNKESYYYTKEIVLMGFGYNDIKIEFQEIDNVDLATQSKVDLEDVNAGIQTINEVRARRGRPRVNWGDTPISVMPGGGQVDPNTGRLVPPSKTPTGSKKFFDEFMKSFKNKLEAVIENVGPINVDYTLSSQLCDERKICGFTVSKYILPIELKNHTLTEILNNLFDFDEDHSLVHKYMDCFMSKVKYVIWDNILKGNVLNIKTEIDKIIEQEKSQPIFNEIFK